MDEPVYDPSGIEFNMLHNALMQAFPSHYQLRHMVRVELNINLDTIAIGESLSQIVFNLIEHAESHGLIGKLIEGARRQNPENPELKALPANAGYINQLETVQVASIQFEEISRHIRAIPFVGMYLEAEFKLFHRHTIKFGWDAKMWAVETFLLVDKVEIVRQRVVATAIVDRIQPFKVEGIPCQFDLKYRGSVPIIVIMDR